MLFRSLGKFLVLDLGQFLGRVRLGDVLGRGAVGGGRLIVGRFLVVGCSAGFGTRQGDGHAGAGAGGARAAVEPLTANPDIEAGAEFAGGIAGGLGVGGAIAALRPTLSTVPRMVKAAVKGASDEELRAAARGRAVELLKGTLPDIKRARNTLESTELVSGVRPTTAQIVNEPALTTMEMRMAKQSPELTDMLRQKQTANNQALRQYLGDIIPAKTDPKIIRAAIGERAERAIIPLQERISIIQDKIDDLVKGGMDAGEASILARKNLNEMEMNMKYIVNAEKFKDQVKEKNTRIKENFIKAEILYENKDYGQAKIFYKIVLNIDPLHKEAKEKFDQIKNK